MRLSKKKVAKKIGTIAFCGNCNHPCRFYHLDWYSCKCSGCGKDIAKKNWLVKEYKDILDVPFYENQNDVDTYLSIDIDRRFPKPKLTKNEVLEMRNPFEEFIRDKFNF